MSENTKKYFSHWRTIDIFNISLFTFEGEKQGDQKYLVMDPQLTLALEIKNKSHFQDLIPELYYFHTNIDNLMIWFTTQ